MKYHRRFLQIMQSNASETRWLLKAPSHSFHIEELLQTYPDATVIQTHRDPTEVIGSISSLCVTLSNVFSRHVDPQRIGQTACEDWARAVAKIRSVRARDPTINQRFIDLSYTDLAQTPERTVNELLAKLFADDRTVSAQRLAEFRSQHRQVHRHKYQLSDFGLSEEQVRTAFQVD